MTQTPELTAERLTERALELRLTLATEDHDHAEVYDLAAKLMLLRDAGVPCELFCPACGVQHIDAPDPAKGWTNPPHRTHECQACGHLWRPFEVATFGVKSRAEAALAASRAESARMRQALTEIARVQQIGPGMTALPHGRSAKDIADCALSPTAESGDASPTAPDAEKEAILRRAADICRKVGFPIGDAVDRTIECLRALSQHGSPTAPDAPAGRDGWRTIAGHAFKDREHVIVAHGPNGYVGEAWWCEEEEKFYMANTDPTDAYDGSLPYATEWQPLPAPPVSQHGEGR